MTGGAIGNVHSAVGVSVPVFLMATMFWFYDTMANMSTLPFPPPPEFGWCDDDVADERTNGRAANRSAQSAYGLSSAQPALTLESRAVAGRKPATGVSKALSAPQANGDGDIEDWDGTVLSTSFMAQKPRKRYRLHNEATGQDILLDKSALLGRRVSATVPQGAMSVKIADPTRTVSRNHAALSFDKDGALWIEDYGSLNGTYIIDGNREQQVKGSPVRLSVPTILRIGDQFFRLTKDKG